MVSRRNLISILIVIMAVFFLFQFSQLLRESTNEFEDNRYAVENRLSGVNRNSRSQTRFLLADYTTRRLGSADLPVGDYILCVSQDEGSEGTVAAMCSSYSKLGKCDLVTVDSLEINGLFDATNIQKPALVVIDYASVSLLESEQMQVIENWTTNKISVVFSGMPSFTELQKSEYLRTLFGIGELREESKKCDGVYLYDGFFFGGSVIYSEEFASKNDHPEQMDLELTIPWYIAGSGTKTYMVGLLDNKLYDADEFPALVWRNFYHDAYVYVVNGDYLCDATGYGFISTFLYENQDYQLYPVVNARMTSVISFPDFSLENTDKLESVYNHDARSLGRDLVLPGVLSISDQNNLVMSIYLQSGYDQTDDVAATDDLAEFYMQQIGMVSAEAGISLDSNVKVSAAAKIDETLGLVKSSVPSYKFCSVYEPSLNASDSAELMLKGITSVVTAPDANELLFDYVTDDLTVMRGTADAANYTASADLAARSIMTAFGYSNIVIDLNPVYFPEVKDDQWEMYYDSVASNISSYWSKGAKFDQVAASTADARVRAMLNETSSSELTNSTITLTRNTADEGYYVLRSHGKEIVSAEGASFIWLENDTYLIQVTESEATLQLRVSGETLSY